MESCLIVMSLTLVFSIMENIIFNNSLFTWFIKPSNEVKTLYKNVLELEAEKRSINIVDEFPRFARLQRKINMLKDEMDVLEKDTKEKKNKFKILMNVIFYAIKIFIYMYIIWAFYSITLVTIPKKWLFPFTWILPYSIKSGNINIIPWLLMSEEASKSISKALLYSVFKR